MQTILIVEDDPATLLLLRRSLEPEGYKILSRTSGLDVVPTVRQEGPSLIILDRRLPGLDGFEVCRQLRARSDVPILMLTASADEVDRVLGLSLGADDYVTKPFSPREVVARVKAILNRTERPKRTGIHRHRDLEVDMERHKVTLDGKRIDLTSGEFKLVCALVEDPERVFSRQELLDRIYRYGESAVVDRAIDVHIANLRKKLGDDPSNPRLIGTVRGTGYRLL